ncbi:nicotinate-nucleotide--dimethylbenzimidazole phosphoribosyltransferase [Shuttleworthella satelles]|uniref:Nicotinate-nucleotide--dimethylbenzimidazole phosphoribosyltransferase n=1 Tax=Shuttleworthella satelles DSM 14600 TaxID=626523 RepID=C4GBH7_9FIRM|nr:nicotinate-nucleotide--dimethylbenzimidazole phosphoribosyltransferase [Shuttleworthia satelles]EEP28470.1 putative nicotinate-nucleotide--dimethylbenzimidazole phosphoribosyltransferase [Shuttleworthia satelles DSM 14600]
MISREKIRKIKALVPDQRAMRQARDRWDKVAMPLDGLGTLQEDLIRMAGILGNADHLLEAPRLLVMCADNGIVAEGVSQTGQEVTALVADSIACGESPSAIFAARCDCQLRVVDVGMACDAREPSVICAKVARGSRNFAQSWSSGRTEEERGLFAQNIAEISRGAMTEKEISPSGFCSDGSIEIHRGAMTEEEALAAISVGIEESARAKEDGVGLLLTGEMGIGNTTTSAACLSALLDLPAEAVAGRGAGLSDRRLAKKREVIDRAREIFYSSCRRENPDPLAILCQVGGFDIAALVGLILGANQTRTPVLLDGLISTVAALIADRLCPGAREVCLASHLGREPGMSHAMRVLKLNPIIHADLALGEGTGALLALQLLQTAASVYTSTKTFEKLGMDAYQRESL